MERYIRVASPCSRTTDISVAIDQLSKRISLIIYQVPLRLIIFRNELFFLPKKNEMALTITKISSDA